MKPGSSPQGGCEGETCGGERLSPVRRTSSDWNSVPAADDEALHESVKMTSDFLEVLVVVL